MAPPGEKQPLIARATSVKNNEGNPVTQAERNWPLTLCTILPLCMCCRQFNRGWLENHETLCATADGMLVGLGPFLLLGYFAPPAAKIGYCAARGACTLFTAAGEGLNRKYECCGRTAARAPGASVSMSDPGL